MARRLEATLLHTGEPAPRPDYLAAMDLAFGLPSGAHIAALSTDEEALKGYFWDSTVIAEISVLISAAARPRVPIRAGSKICGRSRGYSAGAVPPDAARWYGFGSAVEASEPSERPEAGMEMLRERRSNGRFSVRCFRTSTWCLAKSDIAIASRYADLIEDKALRDEIFPRLRREWQASIDMLLAVTGQSALLESNPLLARSIRHRFPYLDPLNHLQIELLKRHRAGDADDRVVRGIHLTINGVAAGLRNSG